MPTYEVTSPDGKTYEVTAPEGASQNDVMGYVQQHHAAAQAPAAPGPQPSLIDRAVASPAGRFIQSNVVQPIESVANTVSNAGPFQTARAALTGGSLLLGQGLGVPHKQAAETAAQVGSNPIAALGNAENSAYEGSLAANRNTPGYADQRAIAARVMQARGGSGFMDQLTSQFNPTLAGLSGFASSGGSLDASNAMADAQQQGQNTYQQAHPLMSMGANALGSLLMMPERGPLQAPPAGGVDALPPRIKPMAQEAHDAGYVLPPRMISDQPGVLADTGAAWSGKVKTAQAASAQNQEITNRIAAQELGLPPDAALTDAAFSKVRAEAGKAYGAIPKALPVTTPDPTFLEDIKGLGASNSAAGQAFPSLMKNQGVDDLVEGLAGDNAPKQFPTDAGMDLVRKLRADAAKNFKSIGDPAKADLAFAQRKAADALDNLVQRNLDQAGVPELSQAYKAARAMIAKSHDIELATNTATGNVSARRLGALSNNGRPFTGGLATVADTANAFPKAMQSEAAFGEQEPLSVLDIAAGAASIHHNPSVLGAVLGRPLARSALLSKSAQEAMVAAASRARPLPALGAPAITAQSRVPLLMPLMLQQQAQSQPAGQ